MTVLFVFPRWIADYYGLFVTFEQALNKGIAISHGVFPFCKCAVTHSAYGCAPCSD